MIFTTGPGNIIQHQSAFQYGVGGQTENGMTYQAGIQQSRTYNNTVFDAYNPYYIATLNLAVTQPLLKNAGMNATKRQLKLAFVNEDAKAAQALIDASNTISQVEDAYWKLVAAWRNVAIQEEALREAIAQQQSNVRLARRGAAAYVDAVESQTQVETFRDDVYSALQNVSAAAESAQEPRRNRRRRSDLARQPRSLDVGAAAYPAPSDLTHDRGRGPAASPGGASGPRPNAHQADIDRAFAKNQSLPQADLRAQYLSNGFAGLLTPVPAFLTNVCTNVAS